MLHHAQQKTILFTVYENSPHFLHIARLLALAPDHVAGSAEKVGIACFACFLQSLLIHKGHHQDFTGGIILNNGRQQSLPIKFQHGVTLSLSLSTMARFYSGVAA